MHSSESIFTPSDTQLCHKYVKIRNLCHKTQAAFWSASLSLFLNEPWDISLPWGWLLTIPICSVQRLVAKLQLTIVPFSGLNTVHLNEIARMVRES
jgi:hypothetical protein